MVMQSEFSEAWMNILETFTFKTDVGESTTVDYNDNSLDTIHEADVTTTTSAVDNTIELVSELGIDKAVGDDIDASLIKMEVNGGEYAINKVKHTVVENKDNLTKIIYRVKLEFVPYTE